MLKPNQVIPFLTHDDLFVREAAFNYFREPSDFGDLTAEHGWAVIDRLGDCEQSIEWVVQMADWPQTDASIARLVEALQANPPERLEYRYQRMVEQLDLDTLLRHRDAILAVPTLVPHVRQQLQLRLATQEVPVQAVWEALMRHGIALSEDDDGLMSKKEVKAAIETLARGGAAICDQAIAIVADHSIEDWRPIFATQVLGQARYAPAIDTLVQAFTIDGDFQLEETTRALARIGTTDVIRAIEAFYPGKLWFTRLYAHVPLGHIKLPESEAALVRWIDADDAYCRAVEAGTAESDDSGSEPMTASLLGELCSLASLAGLERTRALWKSVPTDREVLGLIELLLGVAAMNGVSLPEEIRWRPLAEASRKKSSEILNLREAAEDKAFRDRWRATGDELDPLDLFPEPPQRSAREMLPDTTVLQPIRNTEQKVGRNDPCPCGSGKKFKKCCLGK